MAPVPIVLPAKWIKRFWEQHSKRREDAPETWEREKNTGKEKLTRNLFGKRETLEKKFFENNFHWITKGHFCKYHISKLFAIQ